MDYKTTTKQFVEKLEMFKIFIKDLDIEYKYKDNIKIKRLKKYIFSGCRDKLEEIL